MSFTSADVAAAQGAYLTANADPTVAPGLNFAQGTVVVFATSLYQKTGPNPTDWTLRNGGGGGSGAPVVLADPVAPVLNQQWILHTPAVPGTGLTGQTTPPGFSAPYVINVRSNVPGDQNKFSKIPGPGGPPFALFFDPSPGHPPGQIVITPNTGNGLDVAFTQTPGFPTALQLTTAINAWAAANLSPGVAPIASNAPADNGVVYNFPPFPIPLNSNAVAESYTYKIQGNSGTIVLAKSL